MDQALIDRIHTAIGAKRNYRLMDDLLSMAGTHPSFLVVVTFQIRRHYDTYRAKVDTAIAIGIRFLFVQQGRVPRPAHERGVARHLACMVPAHRKIGCAKSML